MARSLIVLVAGVFLLLIGNPVAEKTSDRTGRVSAMRQPVSQPSKTKGQGEAVSSEATPAEIETFGGKRISDSTVTFPLIKLTGEQITWWVIPYAVADASSFSFQMYGTIGQTGVGAGSSENFKINAGFVQEFLHPVPPTCCIGSTGNVDGDPTEFVDIGDLVALIDYLFISHADPECMEEANVDGRPDGIVDIGDLAALIDYLFINFTQPAECL